MNFLELVKNRHSVRNYTADIVEQEKLNYIIECARLAPSAVNFQPWHFIVVTSEEQRQRLQQCYPAKWFSQATVYIIICVDKSVAWTRKFDNKNHGDIDAAIAAEHICLAATEQGLGSCWVCNFDINIFMSKFQLTTNSYPIAIIPLGYTKESEHHPSVRKEVDKIVSII